MLSLAEDITKDIMLEQDKAMMRVLLITSMQQGKGWPPGWELTCINGYWMWTKPTTDGKYIISQVTEIQTYRILGWEAGHVREEGLNTIYKRLSSTVDILTALETIQREETK